MQTGICVRLWPPPPRRSPLPDNEILYGPVDGIVPQGALVDSLDYRERAGSGLTPMGDGMLQWRQALEQIPIQKLKGISLLVPEEADTSFVQSLNGIWQKRYGVFFNVETVDAETFARRCDSGDYAIALIPVRMTVSDPTDFLLDFADRLPAASADFYLRIAAPLTNRSGTAKIDILAEMEQYLTREAYVTPLFRQNARLLIDPSVSGLQFDPFGPQIDVRQATRTE